MRTFRFSALTPELTSVTGSVRAAHLPAARAELYAQGLRRIEIVDRRRGRTGGRVSRSDVLNLTRHLEGYLSAGMQLIPALEGLSQEHPNAAFRAVLSDVSHRVAAGAGFGDALAAHPKVFDSTYVAMVRAAEATNRLGEVLADVSAHLEREQDSRSRLRSEAVMPIITISLALLTLVAMVVFALPRLAEFFTSRGAALPLPTRILLGVSEFLTRWGAPLALGVAGALSLLVVALRTERGRLAWDRFLLRLPVVRELVRSNSVARFTRVLGSMLSAGVPAPQAVSLAAAATSNRVFRGRLAPIRTSVLQGEGLALPLTRTNLFPANVCQVVRSGEQSGALGAQLTQVSEMYAREASHRLTRMMALFQPLVIAFSAAIVGVVLLSIVYALYGSIRQI